SFRVSVRRDGSGAGGGRNSARRCDLGSIPPVRPARARAFAWPGADPRGANLRMTVVELSERDLCAALRCGDEAAFARLVELHHAPLRRLAQSYVRSAAVADEVVQETWLAVIRSINNFEERSSLKTWIYRILT